MANVEKVTKRQRFEALESFLKNGELKYPVADMIAFVNHEIELLDKKSANKKPSKTQEANEEIKSVIVEVLTEKGESMTVTEILASKRFDDNTSNQKISALLKQLVDSEVVIKTMDKKTARFGVA